MPSLLGCFCVHHRRHVFSARKRNSRKKILSTNPDWVSDTSSDLYNRQLTEADGHKSYPHERKSPWDKNEEAEILSRLLENQATPRRRHVEDIFRQETPVIEPLPHIESLYRGVGQGAAHSMERMNGYVPKAVGDMSASTALTGARMDDFFSDCRLYPALNKFAKPTDFSGFSAEYYTTDRNERSSSFVEVETTSDDINPNTPSGVHIELETENTDFDDVRRGSVSSASVSSVPSVDESVTTASEPVQHSFFFPDGVSSYARNNNATSEPSLENMFHSDGDILY